MILSFTQSLKGRVYLLALLFGTFQSSAQTGSASSPYTALGQAQNVTANGVYYFNLTGTTFSTYVTIGGWVQVAFDYGNGVGNLPQVTALTNTARGILSPTVLSKLGSATKVKITSDYTNFAITSSNSTHVNRLVNNQCLHTGTNDNGLQSSWTGNTSTLGSGCNSNSNNGLHQRIYHAACNGNGFHWVPKDNNQSINLSLGDLPNASYMQLWVQAPMMAVINGPVINMQPSASVQNLCLNSSSAALSVAATGTATITYQWYSNTSPSNSGGTLISGATTSSYSPPTTVAGTKYYYVVATNPQGSTTSAVSGAITTSAASAAGTVSANQTICSGAQPGNITLTGNTGSVQWQSSTDNSNFTNIGGATSTTLTSAQMGALSATRYYRAIVTSSPCSAVTSSTVTVSCTPVPTISSTTPASRCGAGALNIGATTATGVLNWYAVSSGGSSLGTGTSYTTPSISTTTIYYADVTANGCTSPRTAVTATVNALPLAATNTPSSINVEVLAVGAGGGGGGGDGPLGAGGGSGSAVTTSFVVASGNYSISVGGGGNGGTGCVSNGGAGSGGSNGGGNGGQAGVNGCSGGGGGGGGWSGVKLGSTTYVIAGGGAGGGGSNEGSANNVDSPGGNSSPNGNTASNTGGNGVNYSGDGGGGGGGGGGYLGGNGQTNVTGNGQASGGTSYVNPSNTSNTIINGNTGKSQPNGSLGGAAVVVTNAANFGYSNNLGAGANGASNNGVGNNGNAGIVILRYTGTPNATGGTITQSGGYTIHTFTTSGTFAFSASASGASVPNVTACGASAVTFTGTVSSGLTLDWYSAATGGTLLASGTTSYTTPVISSNTTYYVEVRNASTGCVSATRLAVTASINSASTISSNQTLCLGASPASNIILTSASGTIQWQSSTNNVSFSNISGQTSATLSATTIGAISQTTYYRAVVTNGACSGNSPVCTITVNNPTFATTPASGNMVWRGATSSDWNTASNWFNYNGSAYSIATAVPTSTNKVIIPANQTCVLAQPSVNTVAAGVAKDVVIETGATLTMITGNLNINGNLVINGTFDSGMGTVVFNSPGSISGNPTALYNVSLSSGVNFGANSSVIMGVLTINTNGWVNTNPPYYGPNSLLKYNSGGTYGRGAEWSNTSGSGYPNDVQVSSNTILDFPNTSGIYTTNRTLARDLTIDAGSSLYMDYGSGAASGSLNVGRNISISGNLSLGDAFGGDLTIGGNWSHASGTFSSNNRAVFFNGTNDQTMTAAGGENFAYVVVNKPTGNVILANNATISGGLTLTSGLIELGTNTLAMGSASLNGGSSASYVKTASTGVLSRNVGGSATTFPVGNGTYNPAMVTNTGTADIFSLRVVDNVTADGTGVGATTTEAVVNRTWMVNENTSGGSNVTLRLYWNGASEEVNAFSPASAFIAHYIASAGMWDNIGFSGQGAGYFETNNITSFSPFAISSSGTFTPLPIELVSFQANCAGDDKINVTWTTASEYNTSHYAVEHSRNGNDWEALTIVAAAGNSTSLLDYTYVHENPNAGTNYYRLTQYDNDGMFEQFNAVAVDCDNMNSATTLSTYPNPSEGSFYISLFTEEMEGAGVITLTDAKGTVVHTQDVNIQKGNTIFHMDNLNIAPGMYYIQVTNGNESTDIVKHSLR